MDINYVLLAITLIIIIKLLSKCRNAVNIEIKFLGISIKINSKKK